MHDSAQADFAFHRQLQAALGWLQLNAPEEAWGELEEIEPELRHREPVVVLRVEILQTLKRWEAGAALGRGALAPYPESKALYLVTAYCVRRSENIEAARTILLAGESVLKDEAALHFNLACYECQLGNLEIARQRLAWAFKLDMAYREIALDDDDLKPLWSTI